MIELLCEEVWKQSSIDPDASCDCQGPTSRGGRTVHISTNGLREILPCDGGVALRVALRRDLRAQPSVLLLLLLLRNIAAGIFGNESAGERVLRRTCSARSAFQASTAAVHASSTRTLRLLANQKPSRAAAFRSRRRSREKSFHLRPTAPVIGV